VCARGESFGSRIGLARVLVGVLSLVLVGGAAAASPPKAKTTIAGANLLKNGTFSLPEYFSSASIQAAGSTQIPHWTVNTVGVFDDAGSFIQAPPGAKQEIELYDQGVGTLAQTVATVPGTTYLLQWYGAGEPTGAAPNPPTKTMNVLWNGSVVAHPSYSTAGESFTKMHWTPGQVVVTATSTTSTVEFDEATPNANCCGAMVAEVSLAGDANLFLPHTASVAPNGKLVAIVHNGEGEPLTLSGLKVLLYGTYKTASYAPASKALLASAPVSGGQAVLQLKLPASLKGQTIAAHADLLGPNYRSVSVTLTIKVT
jgi:Protein of unknown function (DUF642)